MIKLEKLGYLTASEAIEYMGMPRQSFYNLVKKGLIPKPVLEQAGITVYRKKDIAKILKALNIKRSKKNAQQKNQ